MIELGKVVRTSREPLLLDEVPSAVDFPGPKPAASFVLIDGLSGHTNQPRYSHHLFVYYLDTVRRAAVIG